jgi:hypothetical protein
MTSKLVRIASVKSPADINDQHIGYTRFEDMPVPGSGTILVDNTFYNILGVTIEMTTGHTLADPGEATICLKVQRVGPIVPASASLLDSLKKSPGG